MKTMVAGLLFVVAFSVGALNQDTRTSTRGPKALQTDRAPRAKGPYSQGIDVQGSRMVFLSGQVARDPKTGDLVGGDVAAQTERVLENLKGVLAAGSLDFSHVVRCSVYLTDIGDFEKMNEVYGRYFTATPPARTTVQVSALPMKGARVEIDAIAVR